MCIFLFSLLAVRPFVSHYYYQQPQSLMNLMECVDWSEMTRNLNYFDGSAVFLSIHYECHRYNIIYYCATNDSILNTCTMYNGLCFDHVRNTRSTQQCPVRKSNSRCTMHKLISLSNENQELPRNYPFNDDLLSA